MLAVEGPEFFVGHVEINDIVECVPLQLGELILERFDLLLRLREFVPKAVWRWRWTGTWDVRTRLDLRIS